MKSHHPRQAFFVSIVLESGGTLNFFSWFPPGLGGPILASNLLFEELLVEEIERLIGRSVNRNTATVAELAGHATTGGNVITFPRALD